VAIFNQQPMGFYNLETLKEDAKRHGIKVLNPDINISRAKCTIEYFTSLVPSPLMGEGQSEGEEGPPALRLGFLNVLGLGTTAAKAIEEAQKKGKFKSIADFLENTGVLEEVALNLASAGAFDSLEANRRKVKWEIGLRYCPINSQLLLPLPVEQDLVELKNPGDWEAMKDEYKVLSLFPAGHIMSRLRHRFGREFCCSKDIPVLKDGDEVTAAGMVIRRQRPAGKVVFITLEDEFGHIPLMVFPQVYERYEHRFKSPFLIIKGKMSRREGTHEIVVNQVKSFTAMDKVLESKDWR
jgi:error-prone DNA polymerase